MSKKALIIDSDIELIEQLQDAVVRLGLDAETTTNGNEGVDLASLDQPAVVFLGLMDTKGAGYGLCSKLRRRAPTVPVLMIIDPDEEGSERLDRHRTLKTSADAYLVRPFTMKLLAQTIERLVPGIIEFPSDPEEIIGETAIVPNDSLLGGSLFNDDELRELEREAEQAFSSLVSDPVPMASSREFEVDDLDLVDVGPPGEPLGDDPQSGEDGTQVFDLDAAAFDPPVQAPPALPPLPLVRRPLSAPPPAVADDGEFNLDPEPAAVMDLEPDLEPDIEPDIEPDLEPDPTPVPLTRLASPRVERPPVRDQAVDEAENQALETAQLERDNRSLRSRLAELEQGLKVAREDLTRRDTEVSTQRMSDSTARRELIEVREDLNRREREVLELRDRLTSKDRQLVDLGDQVDSIRADKDKAEAALRASEGRSTIAQQAREEVEHEIENFRVRLSETRVRLDRAKEEIDKSHEEIKQLQRKSVQDLQAAREAALRELDAARQGAAQERAAAEEQFTVRLAGAEARLANLQQASEAGRAQAEKHLTEVRAEFERSLAELAASHAETIAETEANFDIARSRLRTEQSHALEQAETRHAEQMAGAKAAHEATLLEQKGLHDTAMTASRRAYDEEISGLRAEIGTLDSDLESQAAAHKATVERLQAESAEALETLRSSAEKELARTRDEAQARIAELSGQLSAQIGRTEAADAEGRRLNGELTACQSLLDEEVTRATSVETNLKAALETEKKAHVEDVTERDARIVDVVGQNELQHKRIGEQDSTIESLSDDLARAENELAARTRDVAQFTQTIASLDAQVAEQLRQLADARGAVDKARTALAVAQAFLERAAPPEVPPAQDA